MRADDLESLLRKATRGPWERPFSDGAVAQSGGENSLLALDGDGMAIFDRKEDAELVVALRNNAPMLIACLRAAEQEHKASS